MPFPLSSAPRLFSPVQRKSGVRFPPALNLRGHVHKRPALPYYAASLVYAMPELFHLLPNKVIVFAAVKHLGDAPARVAHEDLLASDCPFGEKSVFVCG